jgi:hypothetical protein
MMKWHAKGVEDMKKITNLLMVLMLMASIVPLAFAVQADVTGENPDDDSVDSETAREVGVMNNPIGAQIRLLQLEKAIITNILKGDMTVQVLQGFEVTIDTTELEQILENLTENLSKVRAADPDANNSVQLFVELKHNSTNLTTQFRNTLRLLLDDETIALIKEELKNIYSNELQDCRMKIRHWVRQFNGNQLYRLFNLTGEVDTSLLEGYLGGTIDLDQVRLHLYSMVNQMTKDKQYDLYSEIKGENIRNNIQAHEAIENMGNPGQGSGHGGRP